MSLTVILPKNEESPALKALLEELLPPGCAWRDPDEGLEGLQGKKLLLAVALDRGGCNLACYRMLSVLRQSRGLLAGCTAALVVTALGEMYTKDVARDVVLAANLAGCAFLGRPLVEATGSLRNFQVQAQIHGTDEETAFRMAIAELAGRLIRWAGPPPVRRILALHASVRSTSNTLALWELVKAGLPEPSGPKRPGARAAGPAGGAAGAAAGDGGAAAGHPLTVSHHPLTKGGGVHVPDRDPAEK